MHRDALNIVSINALVDVRKAFTRMDSAVHWGVQVVSLCRASVLEALHLARRLT